MSLTTRQELELVRARIGDPVLSDAERKQLEYRWVELSEELNYPHAEINMSDNSGTKFEEQQDALHEAMFGSASPADGAEEVTTDRVRVGVGLDLSEVAAKYPMKEDRDNLLLALRMEQASGAIRLSDDERPFAETLAAAEDHTVALEEARAKFNNN